MTQPTPITTETLDNVVSSKSDKSRFPQAMLSVSREEFDALQLTVKQGLTEIPTELPKNLTGYVFIVGPAGSVDSPKKPNFPLIVYPVKMAGILSIMAMGCFTALGLKMVRLT